MSGEGSKSPSAQGEGGIERVAVRDKRVAVDTPNVSCCFNTTVYSCTYQHLSALSVRRNSLAFFTKRISS
jgi:hypothetical protein